MLTGGLKKAKTKAVIAGPRASIRAEGSPVFYFYFDDKAAGLGKSYFGIANVSNPNQFALIKLEVAKSNRETVIMEAISWGPIAPRRLPPRGTERGGHAGGMGLRSGLRWAQK